MYLNNHTYFSLRYGTLSGKELLATAKANNISTLPITDINNTSACLNFVRLASEYGIRPVLGIDFRNGVQQQFIGLAKNNEGFYQLNRYLSKHLHENTNIPRTAPDLPNTIFIYPWSTIKPHEVRENEFVGIKPDQLTQLPFSQWAKHLNKLVILHSVSFHKPIKGKPNVDFNIHRLLRAIDNNTLLSKLPKSEEASPDEYMIPIDQLRLIYKSYPKIIENTQNVLDSCEINFEFGDQHPHKNISTYTGSEVKDYALIRSECQKNLQYRYGPNPGKNIIDRIEKELDLIKSKGFVSYFLVNWDIVSYARSKGYYYVGRGSGANSIIAYLLRITDVDPIDLDLYFERFINLYRKNPPDFDIDFSWTDRDDVTRYIFEKFGTDENGLKVSLLATYSTFQYRAVTRELGKAFGLPAHEIEAVQASPPERLDHIGRLIRRYSERIQGFPSHLSIHAGGVLISEKPIHYYTATSLPPKGFPITHFDMIIAEDVGLYKFDILSQRGLSKIKEGIEIVAKNQPELPPIDIHDFKKFKEDEKIKHLLRNAQAIGCFYVESPAMRMLLKKLKADEYLGLVAASSVIRPGVAKSGMMRQYILRFRHPEKRDEAHPVLRDLMPETYGVMVYQEDVIKVAHYFAGLDLGEADVLRRGMSGKYRSRDEFQKVKQKFFDNCNAKGYTYELTHDIWRQIESFAGYAFAKGHSASYAVESYQSLYLKAYYPLEFMVAVINNFGGFYRTELYVHEARMEGAIIEAPCVNRGDHPTIIHGSTIYLGFILVKDLEDKLTATFIKEREKNGPYHSLPDFIERTGVSLESLKLLIRVGAFRFTGKSKKALLWEAHFILGKTNRKDTDPELFRSPIKTFQLPSFYHDPREDAFDEMELLGFPLCNPFLLVEEIPGERILVKDMDNYLNKRVTMAGYMIAVKNTSTSKGHAMNFGTFIDEEGLFIDTVHFPQSAVQYPFRGRGIYQLEGKIVEEFDFFTMEVERMNRLNWVNMEDVMMGEVPVFKELTDNIH
ncbi:MAG: DNA polymerase III subunit alpha [Cyclobacteriaceae bacterium]